MRIEALTADEAIGERERHGGIVCPFPWLEIEGAAAEHLGMKGLSVAAREFQRGAEGVADGKAEKGAVSAVADGRIEVKCDGQER